MDQHGTGETARAGSVAGSFEGDVVINDDQFNGNALGAGHFRSQTEVQAITRVLVFDDEQRAGFSSDRFDSGEDGVTAG